MDVMEYGHGRSSSNEFVRAIVDDNYGVQGTLIPSFTILIAIVKLGSPKIRVE